MVIAGSVFARSLGLALLAAAAGGGLWLAGESAFGSITPEAGALERAGAYITIEEAAAPATPSYEEITARPLFNPERKPAAAASFLPPPVVEPVSPATVVPQPPPPSYLISGVVVSATLRKVLLRNNIGEKALWVAEGSETPEGWRVLTVSADKITILRNSQQISLDVRSLKRAVVSE